MSYFSVEVVVTLGVGSDCQGLGWGPGLTVKTEVGGVEVLKRGSPHFRLAAGKKLEQPQELRDIMGLFPNHHNEVCSIHLFGGGCLAFNM